MKITIFGLTISANKANTNPKTIINNTEFETIYMFDFRNYNSRFGRDNLSAGGNIDFASDSESTFEGDTEMFYGSDTGKKYPNEKKIKIKPIDVLNELETIPTPFSLTNLDEKLAVLNDKSKLIVQKYAKRELNGLIERLKNRFKYKETKFFYDNFQNTNEEKIDNLLSKYDLVIESADIFVPEFPKEAIDIMKKYTEITLKFFGKKPLFYVIAEENNFKKVYEKRDPILLAQSPFGFYYQILGAWDKEMEILWEL